MNHLPHFFYIIWFFFFNSPPFLITKIKQTKCVNFETSHSCSKNGVDKFAFVTRLFFFPSEFHWKQGDRWIRQELISFLFRMISQLMLSAFVCKTRAKSFPANSMRFCPELGYHQFCAYVESIFFNFRFHLFTLAIDFQYVQRSFYFSTFVSVSV